MFLKGFDRFLEDFWEGIGGFYGVLGGFGGFVEF